MRTRAFATVIVGCTLSACTAILGINSLEKVDCVGEGCADSGSPPTDSGAPSSDAPGLETGVPPNAVTGIAAAARSACALRGDGRVTCWGTNEFDELGFAAGDAGDSELFPPTDLREADGGVYHRAVELGGGGGPFFCVRTKEQTVECWGGAVSQCQTGTGKCDEPVPHPVPVVDVDGHPLTGVTHIAVGPQHACAIKADGVYCWGGNYKDQITISPPDTRVARAINAKVVPSGTTDLALGESFTCALAGGSVSCWGLDTLGQAGVMPPDGGCLDDQPDASCVFPRSAVTGLDGGVTAIAAGSYDACAMVDKRVWCWGSNQCGQLGRDFDAAIDPSCAEDGLQHVWTSHAAPATLATISGIDFESVAVGRGETCAVRSGDGTVHCFGSHSASPVLNEDTFGDPLTNVVQLVAGDLWWCARRSDSRVVCWGYLDAYVRDLPAGHHPEAAFVVPLDY